MCKIQFKYFKEFRWFSFEKWYTPIGFSFNHIENYKRRIYESHILLSTPLGCFRFTTTPMSF